MNEIVLKDQFQHLSVASDELKQIFDVMKHNALKNRNTKTDAAIIKQRKGKDGKIWNYIRRIDAMQWLDAHYAGWSFEVIYDSFREYAGYVSVAGKLTVYDVAGLKRTVSCVGCDEIEFRKEDKSTPVMMTYYKNAETDALKRCVYTLGAFNDVYVDDFHEAEVEDNNNEELDWLMQKALPVLSSKCIRNELTSAQLLNIIKNFTNNNLTKDRLIQSIRELNV